MNNIRHIAEKIAAHLTWKRRLPNGFGPGKIVVSPDAMLGIAKPDLLRADPHLFDSVRRHVQPGMRVWDVGANLGLFGFSAAWASGPQGKVLLVEADPWLCSLLQRSARGLAGHGYATISVASCAIADHAAPATFDIAARGRASNALRGFGNSQTGGIRGNLTVGCVTLDQLLDTTFPPDLIKIDVEGAEALVLRSSSLTLKRRPIILIEVSEKTANEVTAMLHAADYELYDGQDNLRPVDRCTWATVALPR